MNKVWLVLRQEIVSTLARRSFQLVAFGLPLLSLLGFVIFILIDRAAPGAFARLTAPPRPPDGQVEGFVDPGSLIGAIPDDLPTGSLREYPDEASARQALSTGEIRAYYLIPEEYLGNGEVVFVQKDFNPFAILEQGAAIRHVLHFNLLGGDAELTRLIAEPYQLNVTVLHPTSERDEDSPLTFFLPYGVMMVYYVLILMSAGFMLSSLNKERENRVLEILMVAVTPRQLLAGKIAGLGLIGLLVNLIWMGTAYALLWAGGGTFQLPPAYQLPPSLPAWGVIYFLLGYAVYASLMGAVGALLPSLRETSQATAFIVIPMVVPLFFVSLLIEQPNGTLAVLLSLIPFTAPVTMMLRLAIVPVPAWQLVLSIGLLGLTAVLILRAVAGLFRAQLLLTGQKITARTISRSLFRQG